MRRLSNIVLFILLTVSFSAQSQDFNSYNFNRLYNFEASSVYHVFQDSDANMWFGTDEGVVKFNGVDFITYSIVDYPSSCTNIKQDAAGRIWFSNFGGQLFYIENGKVIVAIKGIGAEQFISEYHVNFPKIAYIENNGRRLVEFNCSSKKSKVLFESSKGAIMGTDDSKEALLFVEQTPIVSENKVALKFWSFDSKLNKLTCILQDEILLVSSKHQLISYKKSIYYIRSRSNLEIFKIENGSLLNVTQLPIERGFVNQVAICDDQILILTKKGFKNYNLEGEKSNGIPILSNSSISGIFKDREQNWWVSTLNDGIAIIPNFELKNFKLTDKEITHSCIDDDGTIFYVDRDGRFYKLKAPFVASELISDNRMDYGRRMRYNSFNKRIYFHELDVAYNTVQNRFEEIKALKESNTKLNFRDLTFINSNIFIHNAFGLSAVATLDGSPLSNNLPFLPNSNTDDEAYRILHRLNSFHLALENSQQDLYIGYLSELKHYSKKGVFSMNYKGKPILAKAMTQDLDKGIWVGTRDNSLLYISKGKVVGSYAIEQSFDQMIDQGTYLFLWNKESIVRFNKANGNTMVLDPTDGLLENKIIEVFVEKDTLRVIGRNYLQSIPLSFEGGNSMAPHLRIESLFLFNEPVDIKKYAFNHEENSITINFSATATRSQGRCIYEYRLNGGPWIKTSKDAPFARFHKLASGEYFFEVRAFNDDGVVSEVKSVKFFIDYHFTRKWWFILIIALVLVAIVYGVIRFRLNQVRKQISADKQQQELRKEVYKSKIAAIRSQMNPHFMFNALNTIQEFIMTNQKEVASEYLADFADLMRKYLDQSKREEITIAEEIETLEIYLGLENLRVDGKLHYSIHFEPTMNPYAISIPVMLLQPFIENSIKHGLLHKSGDKKLTITFKQLNENRIECRIDDNGVGRKVANEIKKNRSVHYESFATDAINNKVDLVNKSSDRNLDIQTIDLVEDGKASGTSVVISIDI